MSNQKKISKFAIPSLLLAGGFVGTSDSVEADDRVAGGKALESVKALVAGVVDQQAYSLASHGSHSSHESHGSHASHASHQSSTGLSVFDKSELESTRNLSSTPPSGILPSTAVADGPRKLKRLPGNSEKFKDATLQVQVALASRGLQVTNFNGELDASTSAALFRFQKANGLEANGKMTPETLTQLGVVVR